LSLGLSLLLAASVAAAPSSVGQAPELHVVVVGVNDSLDQGVEPLSFADDDAARYAETLGRAAASLSVLTVLDAESQPLHPSVAMDARAPTSGELDRTLREVFSAIEQDRAEGKDADLVFVYVGHGAVGDDGEGYVNLLDEKLTRTALFERVIAKSPARFNHVIVDACSAYHLLNRGKKGAGALAAQRLLQRTSLKGYPNTGVLLSTSSDVETHEWTRIRGGVFSHEVLSALSGAADVDGDSALLYQEVGAFIEAANAGVQDRRARIDFFIQPPKLFLDRPLVHTGDKGPRIALGKRDEGHFIVEDARGVVLAEVNKNPEQPLTLALVGEGPWRISRGDDAWMTRKSQTGRVRLASLRPVKDGSGLVARSAVSDALERGLFRQPFGRSYVSGYAARLRRDADDDAALVAAGSPSTSNPDAVVLDSYPVEDDEGGTSVVSVLLGVGALGVAVPALAATVVAAFGLGAMVWAEISLYNGFGQITGNEAQQLRYLGLAGLGVGVPAAVVALGSGALAAGLGAGFFLVGDE
jgi:hypothetical protein